MPLSGGKEYLLEPGCIGVCVGSNCISGGPNVIYTTIAAICVACMNINKVSRVKYWGRGPGPPCPPLGSYAYGLAVVRWERASIGAWLAIVRWPTGAWLAVVRWKRAPIGAWLAVVR